MLQLIKIHCLPNLGELDLELLMALKFHEFIVIQDKYLINKSLKKTL